MTKTAAEVTNEILSAFSWTSRKEVPDVSTFITLALEQFAAQAVNTALSAFKIFGSEGCASCESGRVNLYHTTETCLDCAQKLRGRG